ncbi:MAG: histidine phosphatase family protein [Candidatus Omnitrophica bacterium]|nr:histidine phosphatase family protein [Candidatus Omnitrophota bacterium]
MPTKLILIRHGETDFNRKKRYSGFANIPLNSKGKRQAGELHKRLKKEKIHKIYVSDRKRAIESAGIAFKDREIELISELREMHFGIFEGLTYKEIMKKHPKIYSRWLKDPFCVNIPRGEALVDFRKRVVKALKNIIAKNKNKTVAVVCHGGPISIFVNHILKSRDFWKYIPKSASLSIIEHKRGKSKIRSLNDTRHLK